MTTLDRFDGVLAGVPIKAPCVCATTAAITLEGLQTIDGILVAESNRVLVKDQASAVDNGIYLASISGWARATDFDGVRDVVDGTLVHVSGGASNGNKIWRVDATNPVIPGQSSIAFTAIPSGDLDDDSVTLDKLAHGTPNQVILFDASGVPVDGLVNTVHLVDDAVSPAKLSAAAEAKILLDLSTVGSYAPWVTSQSVTSGDRRTSDTPRRIYVATSTGTTGATAPTGTGSGIDDGTVTWDYLRDTFFDLDDDNPAGSSGLATAGIVDLSAAGEVWLKVTATESPDHSGRVRVRLPSNSGNGRRLIMVERSATCTAAVDVYGYDSDGQGEFTITEDERYVGALWSTFEQAWRPAFFGFQTAAGGRDYLGLDTGDSPQFSTIELGHASDTTLARSAAGVVTIEGKRVLTAASPSTLTFADPVAWDVSTNPNAELTLTADTTINATGLEEGLSYLLRVIQDGTGGWTLGFGTGFTAAAWTGPLIQTAPGAETWIECKVMDGELVPANLSLLGALAFLSTITLSLVSDAGELAAQDTVAQDDIDAGAITGAKLNDGALASLPAEPNPAAGDWGWLERAEGGARKVDFSHILGGSGTGSYPPANVAGAADIPVGETWRRYTSSTTTLIALTGTFADGEDCALHNRGSGVFSIVASNGLTINDVSGVSATTAVTSLQVKNASGATADWDADGNGDFPAATAGDYFELRDQDATNDGWWELVTVNTPNEDWSLVKRANADGSALTNPTDVAGNAASVDAPVVLTLESLAAVRRDGTNFTVSGGTSADKDFDGSNLTGIGSVYLTEKAAADGDTAGLGQLWVDDAAPNTLMFTDDAGTDFNISAGFVPKSAFPETLIFACSDETTPLTTGTKVTFVMPWALNLTDVKATVTTAPTDATLIVDIHDGATTIMTTNKIQIETGETDSDDATTQPTLTDTALAAGAVVTIIVDQIGSTIAGAGLKVYIQGTRVIA